MLPDTIRTFSDTSIIPSAKFYFNYDVNNNIVGFYDVGPGSSPSVTHSLNTFTPTNKINITNTTEIVSGSTISDRVYYYYHRLGQIVV